MLRLPLSRQEACALVSSRIIQKEHPQKSCAHRFRSCFGFPFGDIPFISPMVSHGSSCLGFWISTSQRPRPPDPPALAGLTRRPRTEISDGSPTVGGDRAEVPGARKLGPSVARAEEGVGRRFGGNRVQLDPSMRPKETSGEAGMVGATLGRAKSAELRSQKQLPQKNKVTPGVTRRGGFSVPK